MEIVRYAKIDVYLINLRTSFREGMQEIASENNLLVRHSFRLSVIRSYL